MKQFLLFLATLAVVAALVLWWSPELRQGTDELLRNTGLKSTSAIHYKWRDQQGVWQYTQEPPPEGVAYEMAELPAKYVLPAKYAAEFEADAMTTVEKFKIEIKGAAKVLANAKGLLVCPKLKKVGRTEGGKCVLISGADEPLYYKNYGYKVGLIAGVEAYSMILVLNTDEALAKFTEGGRDWELGADASVAVANIGAGGELDTTDLKKKDIVSFILGPNGLIGDLAWEGSQFKKLDVE